MRIVMNLPRYLALSRSADAQRLPVACQEFVESLDNYAEDLSKGVTRPLQPAKELERLVERINRMCAESEELKSQKHDGDKVEPLPRLRIVSREEAEKTAS